MSQSVKLGEGSCPSFEYCFNWKASGTVKNFKKLVGNSYKLNEISSE